MSESTNTGGLGAARVQNKRNEMMKWQERTASKVAKRSAQHAQRVYGVGFGIVSSILPGLKQACTHREEGAPPRLIARPAAGLHGSGTTPGCCAGLVGVA